MRKNEVSIHRPKTHETEVVDMKHVPANIKYYGQNQYTTETENEKCFAYHIEDGDKNSYFVKMYNSGIFINPWDNDGLKHSKWKPVNKNVFNNYVVFLNTNKLAYLKLCEKEYIYG